MGRIIYGYDSAEIEFDDRLLAHLKVAIVAKLRRDEKFTLSWDHGIDGGGGRSTVWIHPSIPLQFIFSGSRDATLNREWIEQLMMSANSTGGLQVSAEPREGAQHPA